LPCFQRCLSLTLFAIATILITLPAVGAVHTVDYLPILAPAFARSFICCLTGLNIHIHSLLYVPTLAIPFHHPTYSTEYPSTSRLAALSKYILQHQANRLPVDLSNRI
jgi:hypothetical protein